MFAAQSQPSPRVCSFLGAAGPLCAEKTRRGLEGRIHAGRCTGTPPYGYRVVRQLRGDGELDRGLRAIDPARAAIVRRVFEAYAAGAIPRRIVLALNADGIPGAGGGIWFDSTILGRPMRGDGLLRNSLYAGRLVWRRRINVKDPTSGAKLRRKASPDAVLGTDVPHLRIIEPDLWERVQARLLQEAAPARSAGGDDEPAFWDRRRPRHLLTGKVKCGCCGRPFKTTSNNSSIGSAETNIADPVLDLFVSSVKSVPGAAPLALRAA
jgi:hypothetical protein